MNPVQRLFRQALRHAYPRVVTPLYRLLVRRLPPRAGYLVWRGVRRAVAGRAPRPEGPEVDVAVVALGVGEPQLAELLDRLPGEHGVEPGRVLVVTDSDAVHVAATRGSRLEHVPSSGDWRRLFPDGDYDAFLERRIESITASFRVGRLIR